MNRKESRMCRKLAFCESMPTFTEIFTFKNLYKAADKCQNGVSWKREVQKYNCDLPYNVTMLKRRILNNTYKPKEFTEFKIFERGKLRHIRAPYYEDRIVQKCLCDNFLVPLLSHYVIYDNSATIKNRGTHFAIRRLRTHLEKYSRIYGNEGYIMIFDFKDYFNSIDHTVLYSLIDPLILDEQTKRMVHMFIDDFGDRGLGLGSQVSQICAVYFPTQLDEAIKSKYKVKYYGRYMDDGYIISRSLDEIMKLKNVIINICTKLHIHINDSKIKIQKLSKTFTYLKHRFTLTSDNHIIIKNSRKSITVMRRKLKALAQNNTYEDARTSYLSWRGTAMKYKNYFSIRRMDFTFKNLFGRDI